MAAKEWKTSREIENIKTGLFNDQLKSILGGKAQIHRWKPKVLC